MSVENVNKAVYLGGLLDREGSPTTEVSRRLGEAGVCFDALARVWKHANITRKRKLEVYHACVLPKLLHGLETLWLRKHERHRLDGFQARCLRKIFGIAHSYISLVANSEVLDIAGEIQLSKTLLQRQLLLHGKIARMPHEALQRKVAIEPNTTQPYVCAAARRRGGPGQDWAQCIYDHVLALTYNIDAAEAMGGSSSMLHKKLGTRLMREEHSHFTLTVHTYNDTLSNVTAHSIYSTPCTHYVRDLSAALLQLLQQAAWSKAQPPAGEPRPTNYALRRTPPMRRPDVRPYHTTTHPRPPPG